MSDIVQNLGFDVSQALDALKILDGSLGQLQNRLQSMGGTFGAFNSSGSAADAAAKALGNSLRSDVTSGAAAAQASVERMTVSLGLMSRIVTTQFIVRAMSQLRNEIRSTLDSTLAFEKALSEIQTIDSGRSLESLGVEVRKLSDEFNVPLLQAAKADYDALSNGFSNAAERDRACCCREIRQDGGRGHSRQRKLARPNPKRFR